MWNEMDTAPENTFVMLLCKSEEGRACFFTGIRKVSDDGKRRWFAPDPVEAFAELIEIAWNPLAWMDVSVLKWTEQ